MTRVLMIASEAAPFAKTGGLADVVGALPFELKELGHDVAVILPRYRSVPLKETASAFDRMDLFLGAHPWRVDIRKIDHRGVTFFFVDQPTLFDRDRLYDHYGHEYLDNHVRFAVLSQAALGVAQTIWRADILHCHDWQAALVSVYLRDQHATNPLFYGTRTILTIHNLAFQGHYGKERWADLGLNWGWFTIDKLEFYGGFNMLKGGLMTADALTTVSPRYAEEIQTPAYGERLDGVLRTRAHVLTGILNGVDYGEWSPEVDRHVASHYSASDLTGKRQCKLDLLAEFGLPPDDPDRPLIGVVSRLTDQKGFDLVAGLAEEVARADCQVVLLGSGDYKYERVFRDWAAWLPHKVAVRIGYDNHLAHKIEAGADMFLMPSRYEPCGLNQIYSLRYGTVPVVRATGGLDNTVTAETGFKFTDYTVEALAGAFRAALESYAADRGAWLERMRLGMRQDYSWHHSALEYAALYEKVLR